MGSVIAALERETGKTCLGTYRRCLDRERAGVVEYDDLQRQFMKESGETVRHAAPQNAMEPEETNLANHRTVTRRTET